LRELSHLGHLAEKTFANFRVEGAGIGKRHRQTLRSALEAAKEYARNPEGWLLLTGTFGCGKTHLAAAIANYLIGMGRPVLFQVVPDLLDHLRAAFGPQSAIGYDQRFEEVRTAPYLILDDLGAQNTTPWALEKLYQILNYRYNNRLPTVLTTNVPLEDLDPRLRSRLMDRSLVRLVAISAPDFRSEGIATLEELNTLALHANETFDNFSTRQEELTQPEYISIRDALVAAQEYANHPHGWLVLMGPTYCGKTHLAAAIANVRAMHGDSVLFVVVADLLDYLRASYNYPTTGPLEQRLRKVRAVPFLVLDDLEPSALKGWALEKLYQLLEYRFNALLPTVITTGMNLEQLDMDMRLKVRFMDKTRCMIMAMSAPPYRVTTRKK
jgi:DNA replication protein DnaC